METEWYYNTEDIFFSNTKLLTPNFHKMLVPPVYTAYIADTCLHGAPHTAVHQSGGKYIIYV